MNTKLDAARTNALPAAPLGGALVLVNAAHGCAGQAEPGLTALWPEAPEILLCPTAAKHLAALLDEINGWQQIVPVSGWRSQAEQQAIWDGSLAENGPDFTRRYVALPGHSEHQTGLAIDLGLRAEHIDFIRPNFPYEGICQRFRQRAAAHGFVERYPKEKQAVTGIGHEPWHFRYVGAPHARLMEQRGLVLEEYLPWLRRQTGGGRPLCCQADGRIYEIYTAAAGQPAPVFDWASEGGAAVSVSGDNLGGAVITVEKGGKG